jgi:1-acyl-sn-glycerol-3-phosphate acyltransferase
LARRLRRFLIAAPWFGLTALFRLLYGFRVEGEENLPAEGPYIVILNEHSVVATIVSGWISIMLLTRVLDKEPDSTAAYMQEELWSFSYFRHVAGDKMPVRLRPLLPHGAGRLALGLLNGYQRLRRGGLVVLNPEGDMPWDGRPLPVGSSAAWLGLHTGAPLVPAICMASSYDIWPRWRTRPSLRGQLRLRVGQPFRLCEAAQDRVSDEGLARANARIQAECERLRYEPGGVGRWAGPPMRDGVPVKGPVQVRPRPEQVLTRPLDPTSRPPLLKRGMGLLLWRCPICHTHDALAQERRRGRGESLACRACGARWAVRRVIGRDFRLEVVEGPADLLGLDMALSAWYDEMKREFRPEPIRIAGIDPLPGEQVYLEASHVPLAPHRPNALFDGHDGREAPRAQLPGRPQAADWAGIGEGRLLLTSRRLLWQGPQGELDFHWSSVRSIYLWLVNTLGIKYGTAPYRFTLGDEVGLKWLAYAGTVARQAAERDGHAVTVSSF